MSQQGDRAPGEGAGHAAAAGAGPPSNPVLGWLHSEGARYRETIPFVEGLARELLRAGVDIWRLTTGVHILHPQIDASSCLWQKGRPVTERRFRLTVEGTQQLQNSPMPTVYGGRSVRRRLGAEPVEGEFPILAELRAEGVTDYLALPLPFSDRSWKAVIDARRLRAAFRTSMWPSLRASCRRWP